MTRHKTWTLLLLLSGLFACGRQVVEFKQDAAVRPGADADTPDEETPDADTPDEDLDAEAPDGDTPDANPLDAGTDSAPIGTPDTTAPRVIATAAYGSTGNTSGATGLPTNRASTATFSEPMASATLISPAISFTLKELVSGSSVAGVVTYVGTTAIFTPNANLLPNTEYVSSVSTAATDLAGNPLVAQYVWTWTTAATADTTAPQVILTNPADLATNVPVVATVNATFSEAMRPTTMVAANFTLREKTTLAAVQGLVAYDVLQNILTFSPDLALQPGTDYVVTVTSGATDLAGNALVVPSANGLPRPNPWEFRTALVIIPPPPLAINLGAAASFGIASRAGLTSTGVTVINGDVALSPLASCIDATGNAGAAQTCLVKTYASPNGMTVNGSIFWAGDPFDNGGTAQAVTNALNAAWIEGRNKIDTRGSVGADELGGKTLLPGVYHNAALSLMAGGVAQLDAQNDANAVFFFKVDSSLVDSGNLLLRSRIDLINGAQARNVWFVTGLDITIGSGTTWNGNILAGRTATILDGSSVMGRVLAGASGAGAITLTGAASPSSTSVSVPQ